MSTLARFRDATTLCTFCPSLCHHACPVSAIEARDSVTPWGLMSLARQVDTGQVRLTEEVARTFYHCTGCRACTAACLHGNEVANAMVAARRDAVSRGQTVFPVERFTHDDVPEHPWWKEGARAEARFRREPSVLLLPGHSALLTDPEPVETLLALCELVEEDELACGDASHLFLGHDLWSAGFHAAFTERARQVRDTLASADVIVVMSAEALYTLKELYPAVGCGVEAEILHTSEFLLPRLAGANIHRVAGRVAYHDACHLARHARCAEAPRQALQRVLEHPLLELPWARDETLCCGGTGCLPVTVPETAAEMALRVVELARTAGAERLVTFAPECLVGLRAAAGEDLRVDHAVTLIAEAVGIPVSSERHDTLVIVNPKAGGGVHDLFRRREHDLIDGIGPFDVAFTDGPGDATRLAREALEGGAVRVVVAGGDGTVNEVVNGWLDAEGQPLNPDATLALLAGGTGGDLRRTVGLESADQAVQAASSGRTRLIDVGRLTYQGVESSEPATRYFVNIASFGLGGLVDRYVHRYSALFGRHAYFLASARAILTWKNPRVRLTIDGPDTHHELELPAAMVAVANGRYFGGGMKIAPGAEPDDGLFAVTLVGDVRRRDLVMLSPRIYEGTHVNHPEVTTYVAHTVVAESDDLVWLDVDGEPLGRLPARFEMIPGVLRLAVP